MSNQNKILWFTDYPTDDLEIGIKNPNIDFEKPLWRTLRHEYHDNILKQEALENKYLNNYFVWCLEIAGNDLADKNAMDKFLKLIKKTHLHNIKIIFLVQHLNFSTIDFYKHNGIDEEEYEKAITADELLKRYLTGESDLKILHYFLNIPKQEMATPYTKDIISSDKIFYSTKILIESYRTLFEEIIPISVDNSIIVTKELFKGIDFIPLASLSDNKENIISVFFKSKAVKILIIPFYGGINNIVKDVEGKYQKSKKYFQSIYELSVLLNNDEFEDNLLNKELKLTKNNIFKKSGKYWDIEYDGIVTKIKNRKGFEYIKVLLRKSNENVYITDLYIECNHTEQETIELINKELLVKKTSNNDIVDEKTKKQIRDYLENIEEKMQKAEDLKNYDQLKILDEEKQKYLDQVKKDFNNRGKSKKFRTIIDTIYDNVRGAINDAVKEIIENNPKIGMHFKDALKIGVICRYNSNNTNIWLTK